MVVQHDLSGFRQIARHTFVHLGEYVAPTISCTRMGFLQVIFGEKLLDNIVDDPYKFSWKSGSVSLDEKTQRVSLWSIGRNGSRA